MVAQNIGFAIIAIVMVVGALRVVTTTNVVHAALWLVVVLAGAAAQYILLAAEFVAVTQVLVYIGAVMVLFLFGTMLTRSRIGRDSGLNNSYAKLGIPVAVVLFAAMSLALAESFGTEKFLCASCSSDWRNRVSKEGLKLCWSTSSCFWQLCCFASVCMA
jgi:NADH-quinone oxidoreductase subunit J